VNMYDTLQVKKALENNTYRVIQKYRLNFISLYFKIRTNDK